MILRNSILFLSDSRLARRIARDAPFARGVARRYVAGETNDDAITAATTGERHSRAERSGTRVMFDCSWSTTPAIQPGATGRVNGSRTDSTG
jgi:hypothetical protein